MMNALSDKVEQFLCTLELEPALLATLYLLAELVVLIMLMSTLPEWAVAVIVHPILLAALWWQLYTGLRQ